MGDRGGDVYICSPGAQVFSTPPVIEYRIYFVIEYGIYFEKSIVFTL